MPTRILLADDHQMVREGLAALLERTDGFEVVACADSGREAVRLAADHSPDVVVLDIDMPDMNGIEAAEALLSEFPGIRVLALSMHGDQHHLSAMLKAGAAGYLLKECAAKELIDAVRTVAAGESYLCGSMATLLVQDYRSQQRRGAAGHVRDVTDREQEIIALIADGLATKQVAATLGISVKTVDAHRRNIMEKLGIDSIAELTKYAVRTGLSVLEA